MVNQVRHVQIKQGSMHSLSNLAQHTSEKEKKKEKIIGEEEEEKEEEKEEEEDKETYMHRLKGEKSGHSID